MPMPQESQADLEEHSPDRFLACPPTSASSSPSHLLWGPVNPSQRRDLRDTPTWDLFVSFSHPKLPSEPP